MKLSDLRSSVRFFVFGDSSITQFSDTDIDRQLNMKYRKWLTKAIPLSGNWQVRGTYAFIDLEEGVSKYDIDSEILKFQRVEAKLTATGDYQVLKPIDINDITQSLDTYEPTSPEYDLRDGFITIKTSEDIEDITDGLKLFVNRDLTDLVNTTDEPELAEPFIDLMVLDTAMDYCLANEMVKKGRELERQIDKRVPDFEDFYSNRSSQPVVIEAEEKNFI